MKIAIVGAGAAGCFCAIELKRRLPSVSVDVYEAGPKALAKVAITGGGRCNLTNSFEGITSLSQAYPRGDRMMKRLFKSFDHDDTCRWFENEGVRLVLQEDRCVFPASQDAMEIVGTLLLRMRQEGVALHCRHKVSGISVCQEGGLVISFSPSTCPGEKSRPDAVADFVVVTTGGSPKMSGFGMLDGLGLEIVPPVPSLFTFNLPGDPVRELMGTVVENASVSIPGTKFKASGPLLITHWGMSGPAVLKLSSYAARHLAGCGYSSPLSVDWCGSGEQEVRNMLARLSGGNPQKLVCKVHPEVIPSRLWEHLVLKSGIRQDTRWAGLGSKSLNRLVNTLVNDGYHIQGQSRFREEFVTCGGVALSNLDPGTLECKKIPGLYFAGEVIDVDAVTGGFNLQAAWTEGYVVARSIAEAAAIPSVSCT